MKRLFAAALIIALGACGRVADLQPQAGKSLPQKPALASKPLDAEQLLALTPQAAPNRVDELNKRGEVRTIEHFDLPPPGGEKIPPVAGSTDEPAPSTTGPDSQDSPR